MNISNERGSVVVLVAVMLFLIFFCVALVVDVGHIHSVKIELQRAVDAAALAGAQQIPDGNIVASAVAMGSVNKVDNDAVVIDPDEVKVGWWEEKIIQGKTADQRFTAGGTTINAVKVTAKLKVPHFFFFPVEDTEVTADAVAVSHTINPVLPLAIISCIPTDTLTKNPGALPDMSICGIRSFVFNKENTGAWTSLTLKVNANEVSDLITKEEGRNNFNSIIYGRDLNNDGIENTKVDDLASPFNPAYTGCNPVDFSIGCGLGKIAGKDIAHPDDFPAPDNLTDIVRDATTGVYQPTAFDPLTDYGEGLDGALPRWYNLNAASGALQRDDHFARLWSQDGIVLQGEHESAAAYQARLQTYFDGKDADGNVVKPFGDDRFTDSGGKMIIEDKGVYKPDFAKIVKYAGYPKVYVFNGVSSTLGAFLELPEVAVGKTLQCSADDALPAGQEAVVLKTPVIFAGACEDWQALSQSNSNHELYYVGMAKFLMTRAWKNPDNYDCGSNFVNIGSCSTTFDPPAAGVLLSAVNSSTPGTVEGLTVAPTADGEETNASLIRIFLVE